MAAMPFFVNGMFECANPSTYTMRFLARFATAGTLRLRVYRKGVLVSTHVVEQAASALPTVVAVRIDAPSVGEDEVARYAYDAVFEAHDHHSERVDGTFALIGARATNVRFALVACNDNCAPSEWNAYRASSRATGPVTAWEGVCSETADVIVHMGDQVYADSVSHEWARGSDDCATKLRDLYETSYAEPWQARAMRNALNCTILDDHEVCDGYGLVHTDPGYVSLALAAYRAYQCDLRANAFTAASDDYSYVQRVGAYALVVIDERSPLRRSGVAVDATTLAFVLGALSKNFGARVIAVSPRPLVYLDPICTTIYAIGSAAAGVAGNTDGMMYPTSAPAAMVVQHALLRYAAAPNSGGACVVSGDVHCAFTQTHGFSGAELEELVTSGITRETISHESFAVRVAAVVAHALFAWTSRYTHIQRRSEIEYGANYGVYADGRLSVRRAPFFSNKPKLCSPNEDFSEEP
jgi:hypothetical protein